MPFRHPQTGDAKAALHDDQFEYAKAYLSDKHRMLFLRGPLAGLPHRNDSEDPVHVGDDIIALNSIDPKAPIYLIVDSPGGDVSAGMILYDIIRMSKAPVITIAHNVASMAVTIVAAGHERVMMPHGRLMIHLPSGSITGDVDEIEVRRQLLQEIKQEMVDTYMECGVHAGMAGKRGTTKAKIRKQILKDLERPEFWLTAQSAVDYGIVDRVATVKDVFL